MIDRIFASREFAPRALPAPEWFDGGASYLLIEPETPASDRMNVVRYDSATGARRDVLISAAQLTPAGATTPIDIEDLSWSRDAQRVLMFTNTRRSVADQLAGRLLAARSRERTTEEDRRRRSGGDR